MTYTEQSIIDRIEVLLDGQIQVRRADRVLKDGVIIAQTYHRHVLEPGQDTKTQDARVAAVATAVWTKEILDRFAATKAAAEILGK